MERLGALGGEVRRGVTAVAASEDSSEATVRVRTGDSEQVIRARYVVGADGMHSIVRESAGIGFAGEPYGESFVLADVRMDWPLGVDEVSLFFSPAGLVVVAPLPGGAFRIVATMDDAPAEPGIEHIQGLLDARGPEAAPARISEILWSSRFRVHHRLADTYRKGPFLLMGDAAHVHSPAGGQGMNTGLVDSIVLGEALARVIRDGEPESLLDSYADIRRPAARQVLALAGRLTDVATIRSRPVRIIRNAVLQLLNHLPPFKRRLMLGLSGLDRRRFTSLAPKRAASDALQAPIPSQRHPGRSSLRHAALG
jgi:2-polyprenyl-6-methoxyphenol hydroxylase-like FAD-dependent oxidoreductase